VTATFAKSALPGRQTTAAVASAIHVAGQHEDDLFHLYVALFLLDLMVEHGQRFNGNKQPSTLHARAALLAAFDMAVRRGGPRPDDLSGSK
jgi:hypothetical protein